MTFGLRVIGSALSRCCTIVASYPSLTLEEVHATILYYLHNQAAVNQYLADWIEYGNRMRAAQARNPTPGMLRLRQVRAERVMAELGNLDSGRVS
jgi:hypothetical protein